MRKRIGLMTPTEKTLQMKLLFVLSEIKLLEDRTRADSNSSGRIRGRFYGYFADELKNLRERLSRSLQEIEYEEVP